MVRTAAGCTLRPRDERTRSPPPEPLRAGLGDAARARRPVLARRRLAAPGPRVARRDHRRRRRRAVAPARAVVAVGGRSGHLALRHRVARREPWLPRPRTQLPSP